jgi:hypothetical protein
MKTFSFLSATLLGLALLLNACSKDEPLTCVCPEYYQPVCGENGVTYDNPCFAECEGQEIAYPAPCTANESTGWLVWTGLVAADGCDYVFFPEGENEGFHPSNIPFTPTQDSTQVTVYYDHLYTSFFCGWGNELGIIHVYSMEEL